MPSFLSDSDFDAQYGSQTAPVISDAEFDQRYGQAAPEEPGFLSSAFDATMGGVGKVFEAASYPLNALSRAVARAQGIPVQDTDTMGTMLRGAIGPTDEFTKAHPLAGGFAKGAAEFTGDILASGPLMALGTAKLPAALTKIMTALFAAGAVGEAKHLYEAWQSGDQEAIGKALAGTAGFTAAGYGQHKLNQWAHPARPAPGVIPEKIQGPGFEMEPPPFGPARPLAEQPRPLNEIPRSEVSADLPAGREGALRDSRYDEWISQIREVKPAPRAEAQNVLRSFTERTEGRMEAPAKFYDESGQLRGDLTPAEIHSLWEGVAQQLPEKYPTGYDTMIRTQDVPPEIATETLGREMGIQSGKRSATQEEIGRALRAQKGEVYNRYVERFREGERQPVAAPEEMVPPPREMIEPVRGFEERPVEAGEQLAPGAERFDPSEFERPAPPVEKIPFETLPKKGQTSLEMEPPPGQPQTAAEIEMANNPSPANQTRRLLATALKQLQGMVRGGEEIGIFSDKGTAADVAAAKISTAIPHRTGLASFQPTDWGARRVRGGADIKNTLKSIGSLKINPQALARLARNPLEFVHELVGSISHELAHAKLGTQEHYEGWGPETGPRGRTMGDPGAWAQSMHEGDFALKIQMDTIRQKLYQTPLIETLLKTANDPTSPIGQIYHNLVQDPKWGGPRARKPIPYEGFKKELASRGMVMEPPPMPTMEEGFSKAKGEAVSEANIAAEPEAMRRKALVQQQKLAISGQKNPFAYDLSRGKGEPPPGLPGGGEPPPPPKKGGGGPPAEEPLVPVEEAQRGPITASDYINVPRSLMTMADVSYVFRQAIIPAIRHPRFAWRGLKESLSAFKDGDVANKLMQKIAASPEFAKNMQEGVHWTKHTGATPEEAFYGSRVIREWFDKLDKIHPGAKKWNVVEASERSFTYFLNKMRQDVHNYNKNQLKNLGFKEGRYEPGTKDWIPGDNDEVFRLAAKWANNVTGRGDYPKGPGYIRETLRSSQGLLNAIMFSPRMMISRMTILNPKTYYDYYNTARKSSGSASKAAQATMLGPVLDMATFLAVASGITMATAAAVGGSVEKDPRSSDFFKLKVGNTRFDLFGGFQPFVRTAAQFITNQRKTKYGNIEGTTKQDVMSTFLRGRLAPVPALTVDALAGKDITGGSFWGPTPDILSGKTPATKESVGDVFKTVGGQLGQDLVPLAYQDIVKAYQEDPWVGIASMLPALLGVGVTTHEALPNKKVQREFYSRGVAPPMNVGSIRLGENWEGKPVSYKMTFEEAKKLRESTDPQIYRTLEQIINSPQYQQLSPALQRLLLAGAVREMNNFRSQSGKMMVPPPRYRETLMKGSEALQSGAVE